AGTRQRGDGAGLPPRRRAARLGEQGPHPSPVEPGERTGVESARRAHRLGAGRRFPLPGHAAGLGRGGPDGARLGPDGAAQAINHARAGKRNAVRSGRPRGAFLSVFEPTIRYFANPRNLSPPDPRPALKAAIFSAFSNRSRLALIAVSCFFFKAACW